MWLGKVCLLCSLWKISGSRISCYKLSRLGDECFRYPIAVNQLSIRRFRISLYFLKE